MRYAMDGSKLLLNINGLSVNQETLAANQWLPQGQDKGNFLQLFQDQYQAYQKNQAQQNQHHAVATKARGTQTDKRHEQTQANHLKRDNHSPRNSMQDNITKREPPTKRTDQQAQTPATQDKVKAQTASTSDVKKQQATSVKTEREDSSKLSTESTVQNDSASTQAEDMLDTLRAYLPEDIINQLASLISTDNLNNADWQHVHEQLATHIAALTDKLQQALQQQSLDPEQLQSAVQAIETQLAHFADEFNQGELAPSAKSMLNHAQLLLLHRTLTGTNTQQNTALQSSASLPMDMDLALTELESQTLPLSNQPISMNKLTEMIGQLSLQVQKEAGGDFFKQARYVFSQQGAELSSTTSSPATTPMMSPLIVESQPGTSIFQTSVKAPISDPAWSSRVFERVTWMTQGQIKTAEIQLDPPELGPLQIHVKMNGDQASIAFSSQHAHVRDTLEQALPRLKEMLEQQGINLADANVSDQSSSQGDQTFAQGDDKLQHNAQADEPEQIPLTSQIKDGILIHANGLNLYV